MRDEALCFISLQKLTRLSPPNPSTDFLKDVNVALIWDDASNHDQAITWDTAKISCENSLKLKHLNGSRNAYPIVLDRKQ